MNWSALNILISQCHVDMPWLAAHFVSHQEKKRLMSYFISFSSRLKSASPGYDEDDDDLVIDLP